MLTRKSPLFIDLDGPLLDVRRRYHGVYSAIATEIGTEPLTLDEYWTAKRQRRPMPFFFPGSGSEAALRQLYTERWLAWIEAPAWLSRDGLVDGAQECLEALARSHPLYLVTLRRDQAALARQLDWLGIRTSFDGVFSGWVEDSNSAHLKASWIRPMMSDTSVLIGDSEVDMNAASLLNIRAIGVSFGIREARDLIALGAERVIDDLRELPALLVCPSAETLARDSNAQVSRSSEQVQTICKH